MIRWIVACIACGSLGWGLDSVKVVHSGRPFAPNTVLPVMSRGHLLFVNPDWPELDVYKPEGELAYASRIEAPGRVGASLFDAAMDDQGRTAVSIVYQDQAGLYQGAIAMLDAAGKQTSLIRTDRFMPAHLCFGADGLVWSVGWQRDAEDRGDEDRQDYAIIRRFDPATGQQTGGFILRSSFPKGLAPGGAWGGRWMIRSAGDHIGVVLRSGQTTERLVWLELDQSGKETGRWTLPLHNALAFAPRGLFTITGKDGTGHELDLFDKNTSLWKPVSNIEPGMLMDAEGDQLIVAKDQGAILEWIKP